MGERGRQRRKSGMQLREREMRRNEAPIRSVSRNYVGRLQKYCFHVPLAALESSRRGRSLGARSSFLLSERRSAGIVALNVHNMTGHGHWTIETGIPRRPMKIRQASKQGTPLPSWYLRGIMSDFVRLKSFKFHHPTSYHQGANRSRVWAGVHVAWVDKECNFTAAAMAAIHF